MVTSVRTVKHENQVRRNILSVTGVGTDPTIIEVPDGLDLDSIQVSSGGLIVTIGGTPVTPVAGDDITITGALSLAGNYFELGASNAAVVYGLDDNGVTIITPSVTHLTFVAAQVQATETWQLDLVLIQD